MADRSAHGLASRRRLALAQRHDAVRVVISPLFLSGQTHQSVEVGVVPSLIMSRI